MRSLNDAVNNPRRALFNNVLNENLSHSEYECKQRRVTNAIGTKIVTSIGIVCIKVNHFPIRSFVCTKPTGRKLSERTSFSFGSAS